MQYDETSLSKDKKLKTMVARNGKKLGNKKGFSPVIESPLKNSYSLNHAHFLIYPNRVTSKKSIDSIIVKGFKVDDCLLTLLPVIPIQIQKTIKCFSK